ncbi:hypothetical protein [Ramlibacter lithotrophicus]|nr:hypothetical protein [Ramlibacter lithotrophicus]
MLAAETGEAAEYCRDVPYPQQGYVQRRIVALVAHIGQSQSH